MRTGFDRRLLVVPLATGVYGMVTAAAIHDFGDIRNSVLLSILAGPPAALAGSIVSRMFGVRGKEGWVLAYLAAVLATSLGVGLVGLIFTIGLSWEALVLVPIAIFYVLSAILVHPPVALIWLAGAALVHLAALKATAESSYLYDLDG